MKKILLNKGELELPETWEELTFKQKIFAFGRLKEMLEKTISPPMFRILLLQNITGYKPSSGAFRYLLLWILYIIKIPFVFVFYVFRLGLVRLSGYWSVWKEYNRPQKRDRDVINYNLYRLSEQLDFAFTLENNEIKLKRIFAKNPFPYIRIEGKKYTGKKFIHDIAPFTDITTKEYCDCCELYSGYYTMQDPADKQKCLDKLISILYPLTDDYNQNLVSDHVEQISKVSPEIKFGILYWFGCIVEFYYYHPVYSILFGEDSGKEGPEDKISIGIKSTVLMMKRKGYTAIENETVNDYFDTQVQIIKDDLATAVAKGVTIEELAKSTGMSPDKINKLL